MFVIEVNNQAVLDAFNRLIRTGQELDPVLRAIGEGVAERTKRRFQTLHAPDGTPWAPNSDATLRRLLHGSGKNFTKAGKLSARGGKALAGKRPLHGESGDLARQISYDVSGDSVTIGAGSAYAAIQQFGGKKSEFPHLWGDIPARPFLPVTPGGHLYGDEEDEILNVLRTALQNALVG